DTGRVPLFQAIKYRPYGHEEAQLNGERLHRNDAWAMVRRRARAAGITTQVCNHTFRGTGITAYLENGGTLEKARQMAAHASARTTQLYDRREDRVTLDEVVKINISGVGRRCGRHGRNTPNSRPNRCRVDSSVPIPVVSRCSKKPTRSPHRRWQ